MSEEMKPCPFCGGLSVSVHQGSAYRWRVASCGECGASSGEVRVQTTGEGTPDEWRLAADVKAIDAWNERASPQ